MDAPDEDSLRSVVLDNLDAVADTGFSKPISAIKMEDADVIFHCIALHHTILKSKAELDDLCSGLDVLGVRDMIKNHPDLLRPFFTDTREDILTAGI